MRASVLALAALFLAPTLVAQTLSVTTDKAVYASGEPVVVTIRLDNRTDQAATVLVGSDFGCGYNFKLDGFWKWGGVRCGGAETEAQLPARSAFEWQKVLDPARTGLFAQGGRRTVRVALGTVFNGQVIPLADSTTFASPAYVGGVLGVGYLARDSARVRGVRDSLKAQVLKETLYPFLFSPPSVAAEWRIEGQRLDSIIARYAGDERFQGMGPLYELSARSFAVVGAERAGTTSTAGLSRPSPQPFMTASALTCTPGQSGAVTADLYDGLGRHVQTVYRGTAVAGERLRLTVQGEGLGAGVYVLRVEAGGATFVQRLVRAQ